MCYTGWGLKFDTLIDLDDFLFLVLKGHTTVATVNAVLDVPISMKHECVHFVTWAISTDIQRHHTNTILHGTPHICTYAHAHTCTAVHTCACAHIHMHFVVQAFCLKDLSKNSLQFRLYITMYDLGNCSGLFYICT